MADKPEALRLADDLQEQAVWEALYGPSRLRDLLPEAAAELRRLSALNGELLEALKLALSAHGVMLLSDPPQEAWKTYGVEQKARAAIARALKEKNND